MIAAIYATEIAHCAHFQVTGRTSNQQKQMAHEIIQKPVAQQAS